MYTCCTTIRKWDKKQKNKNDCKKETEWLHEVVLNLFFEKEKKLNKIPLHYIMSHYLSSYKVKMKYYIWQYD